jgi:catechol 2,3-dioxygenase-like lactoylglutathione lyase family enzyme
MGKRSLCGSVRGALTKVARLRITLDHVQVAIPAGGEERARMFFGDLLGLREIPKPAELAGRGGCWFELGDRQLHLGVDPQFRPARKAHVGLAVAELGRLRTALAGAGFAIRDGEPLDGRPRFFTEDPFGNRVEFIEAFE